MRLYLYSIFPLVIILAGCVGKSEPGIVSAGVSSAPSPVLQCIISQAKTIAPKPVDLETAAYAVLGACNHIISAERSSLLAKYPGFGAEVRAAYSETEAAQLSRARREVALNRTR
jgi:hypothetical protein